MAEQMRQGGDAPDQVPATIIRQTRLDALASMTSNGHLTACATTWAKQFRDDIESLRHVDEGATYWIRTIGSSGDGEQQRRGSGG